MSELTTTLESTPSPADAIPPTAAAARCFRCGSDVSRLPEGARYCPRCGLDTHAGPPAAIVARAAEAHSTALRPAGEWQHLFELSESADFPPPLPADVSQEPHSVMLQGYSNAMYKLGRRYEVGAGTARIPDEAVRCYFKSARLGNLRALARLAARWFGDERVTQSLDSSSIPPFPSRRPVN